MERLDLVLAERRITTEGEILPPGEFVSISDKSWRYEPLYPWEQRNITPTDESDWENEGGAVDKPKPDVVD
jgi:hypothetical protein